MTPVYALFAQLTSPESEAGSFAEIDHRQYGSAARGMRWSSKVLEHDIRSELRHFARDHTALFASARVS